MNQLRESPEFKICNTSIQACRTQVVNISKVGVEQFARPFPLQKLRRLCNHIYSAHTHIPIRRF